MNTGRLGVSLELKRGNALASAMRCRTRQKIPPTAAAELGQHRGVVQTTQQDAGLH